MAELQCGDCLIKMICDSCKHQICTKVNKGCLYHTYCVFSIENKTIVLCDSCAMELFLKKRD